MSALPPVAGAQSREAFLAGAELRAGNRGTPVSEPRPVMPAYVTPERMATEVLWNAARRLPSGERPSVVLVMGGGGARGLAHIGILKVFQEEQIPIDRIVGVSVGALVGALYAAGNPLDMIESLATEIGWDKLTDVSTPSLIKLLLREELLSTEAMERCLKIHIGDRQFSDLRIPFACVATDLRNGERVVFDEGPVALAARASATIPAVFKPVEYRQRTLVDGGLVDNLPTDLVANLGDQTLIIAVLPKSSFVSGETNSVFRSLVRAIDIQKDVIIQIKKQAADILIEPNTADVSLVELGRARDCIDAGILAGRAAAPAIKRELLKRMMTGKRS